MTIRNGYLYHSHSNRSWWLVKYSSPNKGYIYWGKKIIWIPKEYIGKKLRFKVEVVEDIGH